MRVGFIAATFVFVSFLLGCTASTPAVPASTLPRPTITTPTPTATSTATPTPTPALAPLAAFDASTVRGPAPLAVAFANQSSHATQFRWDFGDGLTSSETDPSHTYTKVGRYSVRLEAIGSDSRTDVTAAEGLIEVTPGVLASLTLLPAHVEVEPLSTAQFQVVAADAFGNPIPDLLLTWRAAAEAGGVNASGAFTSAAKAGSHARAVTVEASYGGVSKQGDASVSIVAGPISAATLTAGAARLFTGDQTSLAVETHDQHGNPVAPKDVQWSGKGGAVEKTGPASAVFRAGRAPGPTLLTARVTDGLATATATAQLDIDPGYCETRERQAEWKAAWYDTLPSGARGPLLGEQTFPALLSLDTAGEVFQGRSVNLQMEATMDIAVQRSGPVAFTAGGDEGFRLFVDGALVLEGLDGAEQSSKVSLTPGIHTLQLRFIQASGRARLSFKAGADVLQWVEATQCYGGYVEPPAQRYFVYTSPGEDRGSVLDRFGVPTVAGWYLPATLKGATLLPGATSRIPGPKVIVLQGIDSQSACADGDAQDSRDTLHRRLQNIILGAQGSFYEATGRVATVDDFDVIGFSYSGVYRDCLGGTAYGEATYPVQMGIADNAAIGHVSLPLAVYARADTCGGVAAAAQRLGSLVDRILAEEPDAPIVLIGHSMGGMVAAYYLAGIASPDALPHVHAAVTVDSPLLGIPLRNPFSACPADSPAWNDLAGKTGVVPAIAQLGGTALASKLFAINTTDIGHVIAGSNFSASGCAASNALGGARWSPHSCAFADTQSLSQMGIIANRETPSGFSRISVQIGSLEDLPKTVAAGTRSQLTFTFTNTGNAPWLFQVTLDIRRANGAISFFVPQKVQAAPGETVSVTFSGAWGNPGEREVRLAVWQEGTSDTQRPLADTGWLSGYLTVIVRPAGD
ncbi:MAG: PKD domain-containing protein [Chloroflexi bacterium]|nr:PKD domain-containing protein [Chloroflexota bacterium]